MMIEKVRYEKENELNELKNQFFTNITHEFRTPLTLILGPVQEMMTRSDLPSQIKEQMLMVQKNARRLLRLVNQLMEFRKLENSDLRIFPENCNIRQVLDELYSSFKGMADSRGIDFHLDYGESVIFARVDKDKFEKMVYNLVSNAFKYTEDGGRIQIKAGIEEHHAFGDALMVEVEDDGIGISHAHQDKIYERFFQVNRKHTQSTGGIGLYLTKTFVDLHNGYIELESEPGQGSCFRMVLPHNGVKKTDENGNPISEEIEQKTEEIECKPGEEEGHTSIPRVLIVEDDTELNEFVVSGLQKDFEVKSAYQGAEGLEIARKFFPDIIVTDIMMPGMDGIELCTHLRKNVSTSHIPVIFLTAKTMREDEIKGLKTGAIDYIYKPFDMVSLKLKISNFLQARKQIQERIRTDQLLKPEEIKLSSLDENFLNDATSAVNKHLDDPSFDVDMLSREIGLSANQTYRKIKALTGQTAKEFIRNQRLKTAATLLVQQKRSISEIIYMVGFSSPSYFARCFREYYGCTPSEYMGNKDGGE